MTKDTFDELVRLTNIAAQHTHSYECILACIEELGEACRAIRTEDGCYGRKYRYAEETSLAELTDATLCILEVFIKRGGTFELLDKIMKIKLEKWQNSI